MVLFLLMNVEKVHTSRISSVDQTLSDLNPIKRCPLIWLSDLWKSNNNNQVSVPIQLGLTTWTRERITCSHRHEYMFSISFNPRPYSHPNPYVFVIILILSRRTGNLCICTPYGPLLFHSPCKLIYIYLSNRHAIGYLL